MLTTTLLALLCVGNVFAGPLTSPMMIHERRSGSTQWTATRPLDPEAIVPLRIALKQGNLHLAEEKLYSVSDPSSPNYGQHWSHKEIADFFAPSDASVEAVRTWLHEEGIHSDRVRVSNSKGWLHVDVSASDAGRLLDTSFHLYQHEEGHHHIGCDEYSVPVHVKHHIDLIMPTVNFAIESAIQRTTHTQVPTRNSRRSITTTSLEPRASINPNCFAMSPDCLKPFYNITRTATQVTKNSFAVMGLTPFSFLQSDLDVFFGNFSPALKGTKPVVVSIDGGVPPATLTSIFLEAKYQQGNFDLQYAIGLVAPQPVQFYQVGDGLNPATFNSMLDAIDASYCTFQGGDDPKLDGTYPDTHTGGFKGNRSCGIVKPANVIAVSYDLYAESQFTQAYQQRQCLEYSKLGLAGVTLLFGSGPFGVAGGEFCLTPDKSTTGSTTFNPAWPATCPFVTVVGGTQNDNPDVTDPEAAYELSGGGFSNTFALPSYQQSAVSSFFANHNPPYTSAQYNNSRTVRGYPDLSADVFDEWVGIAGQFNLVTTTAQSVPIVGAMITLINDARIEAGKSPVGFINPSIYSAAFASAFRDITRGHSWGCGTNGFNATTGWDPVTGLGTPNFGKLLQAFLSLP